MILTRNRYNIMFQKPVDIKKIDAEKYLIFKYILENARLKKKSYQIYIGKPIFFKIEPSREKGPQFVQKV